MKVQKRIVAIHDISCFGKCSLTVALPVISAAGIETSIIPTAVLSTHTGGFIDYTFRDLTEDILPIINHWETVDFKIDALYTGYLGSFEQIDIISKIFDIYNERDTFIAVDPVMGDHGKLYKLIPDTFPMGMYKLCSKADLIIPNITEALFMLNKEYHEGPYTVKYISDIIRELALIGPKKVVLTGVYFDNKQIGAASYDKETDIVNISLKENIQGYYHGTGDVFASALISSLMRGVSLKQAADIAVSFTVDCIKRTQAAKTDVRFGVNFEEGLVDFAKSIDEKLKEKV